MKRITYKNLMTSLDVSKSTAQKLLKDMKNHYNPKSGVLTTSHLSDYFSVG